MRCQTEAPSSGFPSFIATSLKWSSRRPEEFLLCYPRVRAARFEPVEVVTVLVACSSRAAMSNSWSPFGSFYVQCTFVDALPASQSERMRVPALAFP